MLVHEPQILMLQLQISTLGSKEERQEVAGILSTILKRAACAHTSRIHLFGTQLWGYDTPVATAVLYRGIREHCSSNVWALELGILWHITMCGADVGAIMAAVLGSTNSKIEKLLLDLSGHNVIHPQTHNRSADPDHSVPFEWAHVPRLRHLEIIMLSCKASGVGGVPSAIYGNVFRGLSVCQNLHSLKFDFSRLRANDWGPSIHDPCMCARNGAFFP